MNQPKFKFGQEVYYLERNNIEIKAIIIGFQLIQNNYLIYYLDSGINLPETEIADKSGQIKKQKILHEIDMHTHIIEDLNNQLQKIKNGEINNANKI